MEQVWRAAEGAERVVAQVRGIAERARDQAGVDWRSTAAEGFRHRLEQEAARIRACAAVLEEAAAAVRAHARAVEEAGR